MGNFLNNIFLSLMSVSISRMLLGAGLGLASYATITAFIKSYITQANYFMMQGDNIALSFLGMSGIDVALSFVLSGVIVRSVMLSHSLFLVKT